MGTLVSQLAFPAPPREEGAAELLAQTYPAGSPCTGPELLYLTTTLGDKIAAVHIRKPNTKRTILYSHGNAEDLGLCFNALDMLAEITNSNVFAYDYPGYGLSEGEPSESNCYLAIDAAFNDLRSKTGSSRIIAFGRSIGSGATVDLVSRHPDIRGMVLQSPIESGARAIFGNGVSRLGYMFDIFRNYEKVGNIKCPVLVMHGTVDEVVPFSNGQAIQAGCINAVEPLWVRGVGHNDMPERKCFQRVREFLDTDFDWRI